MSTKKVTVIGLGSLGSALAAALLRSGNEVTVWNRTPAKAEALVAQGAARADTVADAVAASPVVIVCVFDTAAARELLEPVAAGKAVVNLTTGSPDEARALATWAASRGVDYLDGAVMAVPEAIGTPGAFVIYSGSREVFDEHRDALDSFGASHFLGTDAGVAEFHDLGLLSAGYATLGGFLHAVAMLGVPAQDFLPLATTWLNGMVAFLADVAREVDQRDYAHGASSVAINQVALGNIVHASRSAGVAPDLLLPLKELMDRRAADGHAEDSASSVIELLRPRVHPE
ncbi:NAD(P)-binding domain-containing protein [Allokutzneria sp. A3M-2-11 16]|uniref:NAD(P)-dependent oxidoreductase n=1 Tax=Allokutzneria sp. A3M-2-11 16 TaxID=2962043 RepID=UPI0020B76194|nr:NAD(P)-binding domain-containing protein [Allokutzneria sp. A3M-2-11 16]MCP3802325.1 NAD(P)-binding domain-containing protein [Allokutzneria sp. A3M-2-11 16]